jgi:outer membrane biosynthesis protein TonB
LLHLLAFLVAGLTLPFWQNVQPRADESKAPLPPLVFTLAETPESARRETPPEKAEHVSDKNAVAQNPTAPEDLPTETPFATGSFADATAAPAPIQAPPRTNSSQPENAMPTDASHEAATASNSPAAAEPRTTNEPASSFSREFLTGEKRNPSRLPGSEAGRDNRESRAPDLGSFSLNTYEWDFAPYMLWLKERIQRNIYPPPAFTHMGIISGQTRLRFRIDRDGTLHGLELLGFEGHKSLMETSVRAVELSAPFRSLPADFPENHLEVTAQFEYIITR